MLPRLFLVGAIVVGIAFVPGVAGAQTPAQDSVTGSGVSGSCGGDNVFAVDASSGPSGENPTGTVTCGTLFSGPVSCLSVTGNVALLTVQSSTFGLVGVRITDLGSTGDTLEAFLGAGCPTPLSFYIDFAFRGDIVVVDAPPLPTSKDQCKNGGWQSFGFKNQGDCVSFVATGGKNPPAGSP